MENFFKEIAKLYVQDGFIQGLESLVKQIKKLEQNAAVKELPADVAFRELRQQAEETISGLKERQKKAWKGLEAKHTKETAK